jgi:hypothetical protein
MGSVKRAAIRTIESLQDDVGLSEIIERLYLLQRAQRGARSTAEGERPPASRPGAAPPEDIFDFIASLPVGSRSKEEIDHQIRQARERWEDR